MPRNEFDRRERRPESRRKAEVQGINRALIGRHDVTFLVLGHPAGLPSTRARIGYAEAQGYGGGSFCLPAAMMALQGMN